MSVSIGFGLVTAQVPLEAGHSVADEYADTLELAELAEQAGFDSYWVSEHHLAQDSYLPSPLVLLGAVAARTSRIILGTGVVLAPFQEPLRFAEDCAVVDQLSRGRFVLGVGGGWRRAEFARWGIETHQRVSLTTRLVATCREAWAGDLTPIPYRPIPVLLGGTVPAAIERAGRLGDGYIGTPGNDLEKFAQQVAIFDAAVRESGRDPFTMPIGFHLNYWVSDDGEIPSAVLRAMWHQIGTYKEWHAHDDGLETDGQLPPYDDAQVRGRTIFGTPGRVVDQLRPWVERFPGRDLHIILRLHYPGMRTADAVPALKLTAARVIPHMQSIAAAG